MGHGSIAPTMRHIAVLIVIAVIVGAGASAWYFWPNEQNPLDWIPVGAMGVIVINEFPESIAPLAETRVAKVLGIGDADLADNSEYIDSAILPELRQRVEGAWVCVHGLRQKEAGTFRIEFSIVVRPKIMSLQGVREWVEGMVVERFGEGHVQLREAGATRVIQGGEAGQVLWSRELDGMLLFSNSETGMSAIDRTREGLAPAISGKAGFREAWEQVGGGGGAFIYMAGGGPANLIPELGYGLRFDQDRVFDAYWEVKPPQE